MPYISHWAEVVCADHDVAERYSPSDPLPAEGFPGGIRCSAGMRINATGAARNGTSATPSALRFENVITLYDYFGQAEHHIDLSAPRTLAAGAQSAIAPNRHCRKSRLCAMAICKSPLRARVSLSLSTRCAYTHPFAPPPFVPPTLRRLYHAHPHMREADPLRHAPTALLYACRAVHRRD